MTPAASQAAALSHALTWQSYPTQKHSKGPLLDFILDGLRERGCQIIHADEPNRAPHYIVFDTPLGERIGLLAYAFLANARQTANRPADEHRFQIKYGSDLSGVLHVATDPHELVTTIFLGIDPQRGVFVAADPLMNTPSPMSRSVEFKAERIDQALAEGWAAWERERFPGKSKHRPTLDLEDLRTEVLIAGRRDRLLDLIALERVARGLDPGERHLVADMMQERSSEAGIEDHKLLKELGLSSEALLDLIDSTARLKMAVRGWVAEKHLADQLCGVPGVSECVRLTTDGQPDISLRWKDSAPVLIECKNTLRDTAADGSPKVDFQRTRASVGDKCSRFYRPADFPILAACLHAVTADWEFRFARTTDLAPHPTCAGRIATGVRVAKPLFSEDAALVLDTYIGATA